MPSPNHIVIVLSQLYPTSQMLAECIAFGCSPNKAVVGANAFTHESGIHQHGMMVNPLAYEIMTPESVGAGHTKLVLGKHSGRHALADRLERLGHPLDRNQLDVVYASPNSPTARTPSMTRTCLASCNQTNQSPLQPPRPRCRRSRRSVSRAFVVACSSSIPSAST